MLKHSKWLLLWKFCWLMALKEKLEYYLLVIRKANVLFMVMKFETDIGFMDLECLKFLVFMLKLFTVPFKMV